MALPKRHRRNITCEGRKYHWYYPQGRDFEHQSDIHLIIQLATGKGQVLKIDPLSINALTPAFVAEAIAEALRTGWNPEAECAPFILTQSPRK